MNQDEELKAWMHNKVDDLHEAACRIMKKALKTMSKISYAKGRYDEKRNSNRGRNLQSRNNGRSQK